MIIETSVNLKNKNKDELIALLNDSLKVIQTQQAELEKYKKDYIDISKRANEYKKAIECKKCDCSVCEAYLNNIELQAKIEKKDKIIDEMAEQLTTPIHSKEWVKEYFERKAKNE